jgi:hypothetical protein
MEVFKSAFMIFVFGKPRFLHLALHIIFNLPGQMMAVICILRKEHPVVPQELCYSTPNLKKQSLAYSIMKNLETVLKSVSITLID